MNTKELKKYRSNIDVERIKQHSKNLTPEQRKEAIVSNIYGLMDSDSKVTKQEIREELAKFYS